MLQTGGEAQDGAQEPEAAVRESEESGARECKPRL